MYIIYKYICLCVYIYTCMYKYICMYIQIYTYTIYIYVNVYIDVCIYMHIQMPIDVYIHVYGYLNMHLYMSTHAQNTHIYACLYLSLFDELYAYHLCTNCWFLTHRFLISCTVRKIEYEQTVLKIRVRMYSCQCALCMHIRAYSCIHICMLCILLSCIFSCFAWIQYMITISIY